MPLMLVLSVFISCSAQAYIGPGAGVALIGTFFGFAAAVGASIVMIVAWPAWILWKRYKKKKEVASQSEDLISGRPEA